MSRDKLTMQLLADRQVEAIQYLDGRVDAVYADLMESEKRLTNMLADQSEEFADLRIRAEAVKAANNELKWIYGTDHPEYLTAVLRVASFLVGDPDLSGTVNNYHEHYHYDAADIPVTE